MAPMVARESILKDIESDSGQALTAIAAAASSAIKLFPSDRTIIPPDQRGLSIWSVMYIPLPEFATIPFGSVDPSVETMIYEVFLLASNIALRSSLILSDTLWSSWLSQHSQLL